MALPDNILSSTSVYAPFLDPHQRSLRDPLVDYERGGVALQDPSQGLNVRNWRAFITEEGIWLQSRQAETPVLFLEGEEINQVSLAFGNNMHPVIVYRQLEVVKMSWFDSAIQARVITEYPEILVGAVTLDDIREGLEDTSDILFIYIRDEAIFYRQQRDRFGIERFLTMLPSQFVNATAAYCEEDYCELDYTGMVVSSLAPAMHLNIGMNNALRIQIELAV